jgi:FkbM family methyltransferase
MSEPVYTVARHGRMVVLATDTYVSRSLVEYGEYAPGELALLSQLVGPSSHIVEVGAHIGALTLPLAKICHEGRVYAFEPQQRLFQMLCANMTINGVTNVRAYPTALGRSRKFCSQPAIDYERHNNFGGISFVSDTRSSADTERVEVAQLDDFRVEHCNLIKIDVEGMECDVLRGAHATIRRLRPVIYLENDRANRQQEVIETVNRLGYVSYWHPVALFEPQNFRGSKRDVFGNVASLNMLCIPSELSIEVVGLDRVDPANWHSPIAVV